MITGIWWCFGSSGLGFGTPHNHLGMQVVTRVFKISVPDAIASEVPFVVFGVMTARVASLGSTIVSPPNEYSEGML